MKYRSDCLFGMGVTNVKEVIKYETFELMNSDIPDTLVEQMFEWDKLPTKLQDYLELFDNMESEEFDETFYDDEESNDEIQDEFVDLLVNEVNKIRGKNIVDVLWLCDTKQDVINCYDMHNELTEDSISAYQESNVIISDLGVEGKLYGYEKNELQAPIED